MEFCCFGSFFEFWNNSQFLPPHLAGRHEARASHPRGARRPCVRSCMARRKTSSFNSSNWLSRQRGIGAHNWWSTANVWPYELLGTLLLTLITISIQLAAEVVTLRWHTWSLLCLQHGRSQDFCSGGNTFSKKFSKNFHKYSKNFQNNFKKISKKFTNIF